MTRTELHGDTLWELRAPQQPPQRLPRCVRAARRSLGNVEAQAVDVPDLLVKLSSALQGAGCRLASSRTARRLSGRARASSVRPTVCGIAVACHGL